MLDRILEGHYATIRGTAPPLKQVRVLNWNIERGLNLPAVMDFVRSQQPDLCILQEVDLNAKRTGRRNVAEVLAAQFQFNYVFGVEFEELSQGSDRDRAFHGQAVFARSRIMAPRILRFSRQSDRWRPRWYLPCWSVLQPRRGGRMALVAELDFGPTRLVIYDVHLESQGDDHLRLWQLSEVVQDSLRYSLDTPVVVAGDLNTRHGPAPLRPYLLAAGFHDACGDGKHLATKRNGQTLDWVFIRGPALCSGTRIHQEVRASDHYPLTTNLTLTGRGESLARELISRKHASTLGGNHED